MCGLVGLVGLGDPDSLDRMTDLQTHRGPDARGTWTDRTADGRFLGLGSRRLAIRDLSPLGRMPMSLDDAGLHLVYNGELYNASALRVELESAGVRFRSTSDTEVVLHALARWGTAAIDRFEGMFALAAIDLHGRLPGLGGGNGPALLIARDAFGIKPLYLHRRGDGIAVASEAKSLLALPGFQAAIDPVELQRYLTLLWVPEPGSLFAGVDKLPAGHFGVFRNGELRVERYWDVPVRTTPYPATDRAEVVEEIRERFDRSVRDQMVSDVPLGAFLSAGVDSTAIVARMAEHSDRPVKTFTITFPEHARRGEISLDDPAVAARTAARFGCDHRELVVEPDVVDLLPKLVGHLDDPVADPAVLTAYTVCRQAREDVTVLLSGVGGDELFAGYRKHVALRMNALWRRIPGPVRRGLVEPAIRALPGMRGTRMMGPVRLAKKWARTASYPSLEAFLRTSVHLDERDRAGLLSDDLAGSLAGLDPLDRHRAILGASEGADPLDRALDLDLRTFMPSLNLLYNDRMSMAASLEVRVPFLDRPLTETAFRRARPEWKLEGATGGRTKAIFRDALGPDLPAEVLRQPKAGFGGPHDHWLAHDLRPLVDELLSEDEIRRRGLFRPAAVRALVDAHRAGRADRAYPVWQLMTLELWCRTFLDGTGLAGAP